MYTRRLFLLLSHPVTPTGTPTTFLNVQKTHLRFFKKAPGAGSGRRLPSSKPKKKIVDVSFDKGHLEQFNVVYEDVPKKLPFSRLARPFVFASVFTGLACGGAAVWKYEGARSVAMNRLRRHYSGFIDRTSRKRGELREVMSQWYSNLSGTQKVVLGIIATNIAVFAFWRIPAMQHFMVQWFSANPASSALCLPMILCVFSHHSLWHLAVNMYVLWSFSGTIGAMLGKEQFLAMYLSAGVWSSFASYALKIATSRFNPSLGASGAIMAVLGSVCYQNPDAKLAIIFLPFITFSASTGLTALLTLESLGCILGWQFFDHAAHLSGLLFGIYYVQHGHKVCWDNKQRYLTKWHEWRGKPTDV